MSASPFVGSSPNPIPPSASGAGIFASVPHLLKDIPHWLVWREEKRNDKPTKVPYDAKRVPAEVHAAVNAPDTWSDFETAVNAADPLLGSKFDGIGFVLLQTDLVGIDFDGVLEDGVAEPYVLSVIRLLGNPYCEITPSCTGLRIFVECDALPEGGRKFAAKKTGVEKYGAEIYSGGEGGRYLTVTGNKFGDGEGVPRIEDISVVYFLTSQFGNEKFKRWWTGDSSDYAGDDSRLDMALMGFLARQFNGDAEKMERVFTLSVPGHREKWVNRADYRERTIKAALSEVAAKSPAHEVARELEFHLPAVVTDQIDDYAVQPASGQSDGWFPLGSPSLIGGASGSAKSTWMMQLLLAQFKREPVLGHATNGRPFLVLMADRGEASHKRTMRRMNIEPANIPIRFFTPKTGLPMMQEIVSMIEEVNPLPQIVFIEGADFLVDDGNDKHDVTPFMSALQKIATHYHIAIIGSVGSPKSKAGEGYIAKRDNISGTEAWARLAETVVLLQYPKGQDTVAERELSVLPRNAPSEAFAMIFKQGRLVLQTESDKRRAEGQGRELEWVQLQALLAESDPNKKWWTRLDMRLALNLSKTTVHEWIQNACTKGWTIEKPGKKGRSKKGGQSNAAQYQWNASKTNPLWTEHEEDDLATTDILIQGVN